MGRHRAGVVAAGLVSVAWVMAFSRLVYGCSLNRDTSVALRLSTPLRYGEAVTATAARRAPARRGDGVRLRAEILAATSRLLAELGDAGALSLRAVAREVGVATTSIYLHFTDLDALVTAVKEQHFAELSDAILGAVESAGDDPYQRVRAIAYAYVSYGLDNPGHYRVLFIAPYTVLPPEDQAFLGEAAFDTVRAEVGRTVGADRARLVAIHFWTALHGLITLRMSRRHFPWPPVEREVDDLVTLLLAAPDGSGRLEK